MVVDADGCLGRESETRRFTKSCLEVGSACGRMEACHAQRSLFPLARLSSEILAVLSLAR